jgi:hypothetical protein
VVLGTAAERLSRRGISTMAVAAMGMGFFMAVMVLIVWGPESGTTLIWMLFGFFGTSGILPYAALSQSFPLRLSGRVNTTLNLLVFLAAFAAQWGIGAIIGIWPATPSGGYAPVGYQAAFGILLAIQLVTIFWYWFASVLLKNSAQ